MRRLIVQGGTATLLCALASLAATPKASGKALEWYMFKMSDVKIELRYREGGFQKRWLGRKRDGKYPINANYFVDPGRNPRKRTAIDYLLINGKEIEPYRFDLHRAIFAYSPTRKQARILVKPKCGPKDLRKDEITAFACSRYPPDPGRRRARHIIAVKGGHLILIYYRANAKQCFKLLKSWGIREYIFADGGSAAPANVPVAAAMRVTGKPVRIVRR